MERRKGMTDEDAVVGLNVGHLLRGKRVYQVGVTILEQKNVLSCVRFSPRSHVHLASSGMP